MKKLKITEVKEMWGTLDERVGVKLKNGGIYFSQDIKVFKEYFIGNFTSK